MQGKKIYFQGSLEADEYRELTFALCKQLARQIVRNRSCLIFGGITELEIIMAQEIKKYSEEEGLSADDYLSWYLCATDVQDERIQIGQRFEMDDLFAFGGHSRLRTHLIYTADALITVGGAKGVLDSIEKARLSRKPFFPIPLVGGQSHALWNLYRNEELEFCSKDAFTRLGDKNRSAENILEIVFTTLKNWWYPRESKVFIIHGHDGSLKYELKDFIQNSLKLGEPIILMDEPSRGQTIIEKLDEYSGKFNIAFVLMTPDDKVATGSENNEARWRSRQNVIFELGYFFGKWGRRSGRVLLLNKGPLELPSDIGGLTYISVDNGIKAAAESIRRELIDWI
jgi:predicted nucleotide-binding protein